MADEVRAEYSQLQQVASQFSKQATAINRMQGQVKRSMTALQGNWIGKGSKAFFSEMDDEVMPATNRLYKALQEAGKATKQIAQILQQAEQDAAMPFRQAGDRVPGMAAHSVTAVSSDADSGSAVISQGAKDRWARLSTQEKTQALQRMADEIAAQYGMDSLPVTVEQLEDPPGMNSLGYWDGSKIHIDVDDLNNPEAALNTLAHEARHAVQREMADQATPNLWARILRTVGLQDTPQWPQYGISEETAKKWDDNFQNYQSPDDDFDKYWNQPVEVDAREAGDQFVDGMTEEKLEKYIPDPKPQPVPAPTPPVRSTPIPGA